MAKYSFLYNDIESSVLQAVSIIGKRLSDKNGNSLFGNTTLSSAEQSILEEYIKNAANILAGELAPLATVYTDNDNIHIEAERFDVHNTNSFGDAVSSFVVTYVIYMVLSLTNAEQAKMYEASMNRHLSETIKVVFETYPPKTASKTLADMKGSVDLGDGNVAAPDTEIL